MTPDFMNSHKVGIVTLGENSAAKTVRGTSYLFVLAGVRGEIQRNGKKTYGQNLRRHLETYRRGRENKPGKMQNLKNEQKATWPPTMMTLMPTLSRSFLCDIIMIISWPRHTALMQDTPHELS